MDEKSWWDLWNTSHRTKENNDEVSSELFARAAVVINEITQSKSCRMLEVACGAGALSRKLVYSSYQGLDISPAAIELARQKSERISPPAGAGFPTYQVADFHDTPVPEQPFDIIVCVDAISCVRDQQLCMNKMAQSLRTGGHLVLTTVSPFVYNRIQRTQTVRLESGPVSHWLSRGELQTLIKRAGLKIERSYTIMPRGNLGILRIVNSWRLNSMLGPRAAPILKRLKEHLGLGQYRVVIARKAG
ncbi:MAG: class I SAM-dependent methyltransferase [Candidatus Acidiferrales bacterium]